MKNLIIIPTYNESANIGPLVQSIFGLIPEIYVCIVDDNSPDGTGQLVDQLLSAYPHLSIIHRSEKQGLGPAYIEAFQKVLHDTSVDRVIMMDADFSHDPKYLPEILKQSQKYDLVIGSRYVTGGGISHWAAWRKILSRGGNIYVRMILGIKIHDWTSGFNCISADILRRVDLSKIDLSGYAFISELKYLLMVAGARVCEIPIVFEERKVGISKISPHIIFEGVFAPWKIRLSVIKNSLISFPVHFMRVVIRFIAQILPENSLEFIYITVCKLQPVQKIINRVLSLMIPEIVTIQNIRIALNRDDPVVSGALMLNVFEKFESNIFRQKLKPGMTVIDIGANVGFYTALAAHGVGPEGIVIAFEPDPENFSYLKKTVNLNQVSKINCIAAAVSDHIGRANLFFSEHHRGDHRMYDSGDSRPTISVEVTTVDHLAALLGLKRVDIIKMDIQGFEPWALKGMTGILHKFKPVIFTEFWPEGIRLCGAQPLEFLRDLFSLGYQISEININKKKLTPVVDFEQLINKYSGRKFTNLYCVYNG